MANRILGVHGKNLPTKKSRSVNASDFSIGGIVGQFERKYDKSFVVQNQTEFQTIFGLNINSAFFGSDAVAGFFENTAGVNAKLYVKSHVGYTAGAIDAVTATANLVDGTPESVLQVDSAYQNTLEYGISGNRTGYTVTNGDRFTTAASATAIASATTIFLDSVADIKIGDMLKIQLTGGAPVTVNHVITAVDEAALSVTWVGVMHATSTLEIDDVVSVVGFRLRTYRKDIKGIVTEVDSDLGKIFCAVNPLVTDYYVSNIFETSNWIKVTRLTTTPATPDLTFPIDVASVAYLASGADGTAATTAAHWARDLTKFDTDPIRFICNPETATETIQKAIETYCQGRTLTDDPKVFYNIAQDQTKAQLLAIGGNYQRSDDVLGLICADRLEITDPFASSTIAPPRVVPNVGHIMGLWIYTIETKGIHYIPQMDTPLRGIVGIDNDNTEDLTDVDRTDLANAGINIIQFVNGSGYILRNGRTPSTTLEFKFLNGIVQREYIKVSAVDSLQTAENQPNSFNRIKENKSAIDIFMYRLWDRGSNGNVPRGETFGQSFNDDGTQTDPTDHFEVVADLTNNTQIGINAGEQNIDIFFTYPSPAESIQIGTGFILR